MSEEKAVELGLKPLAHIKVMQMLRKSWFTTSPAKALQKHR
jgi:hypothetical protein